jgi:hypothetical protein
VPFVGYGELTNFSLRHRELFRSEKTRVLNSTKTVAKSMLPKLPIGRCLRSYCRDQGACDCVKLSRTVADQIHRNRLARKGARIPGRVILCQQSRSLTMLVRLNDERDRQMASHMSSMLLLLVAASSVVFAVAAAAVDDDPTEAWAEWEETEISRRVPRRQREITEGMDIRTVLGMAEKKRKVFVAHVRPDYAPDQAAGETLASRFFNMMHSGGVSCQLRFYNNMEAINVGRSKSSLQIVVNAETVRDAHEAKWFLLKQKEIERVVMDNLSSTPAAHEDDDDDSGEL